MIELTEEMHYAVNYNEVRCQLRRIARLEDDAFVVCLDFNVVDVNNNSLEHCQAERMLSRREDSIYSAFLDKARDLHPEKYHTYSGSGEISNLSIFEALQLTTTQQLTPNLVYLPKITAYEVLQPLNLEYMNSFLKVAFDAKDLKQVKEFAILGAPLEDDVCQRFNDDYLWLMQKCQRRLQALEVPFKKQRHYLERPDIIWLFREDIVKMFREDVEFLSLERLDGICKQPMPARRR